MAAAASATRRRTSVIKLKRAYKPAASADGTRILVDRLWPRGAKRSALRLDAWLRELAPSDSLRRWFAHDPQKWATFRRRYTTQLDATPDAVAQARAAARRGTVTLVYGARDPLHNNAVALREYLSARSRRPHRRPRDGKRR
jgi:uncharacterized protein YeaO (DUF488 family)